jgi:hypothetical protein
VDNIIKRSSISIFHKISLIWFEGF